MDWLVKEATAKEQDVGEMVGEGVGPTAKAEVEQEGLQDGDRKDRPLLGGGERGEMESASTVPVEGNKGHEANKEEEKRSRRKGKRPRSVVKHDRVMIAESIRRRSSLGGRK